MRRIAAVESVAQKMPFPVPTFLMGSIYPHLFHTITTELNLLIFQHSRRHCSPSRPRMNLLETTKLVKSYNGRVVVNQVSFVLHQEEIIGILGRNGAGKTTTFRMIMGMIKP